MAREIEKGHGKREEKGCENVTDKDDLNTADKQLTLSCVDLRITTAQHLNETRKAPPSDLKHEDNSRMKLVVLIGACYNIFVAPGFPFAIGALYLEILDTFNSTRGETSLVPAFCLGMHVWRWFPEWVFHPEMWNEDRDGCWRISQLIGFIHKLVCSVGRTSDSYCWGYKWNLIDVSWSIHRMVDVDSVDIDSWRWNWRDDSYASCCLTGGSFAGDATFRSRLLWDDKRCCHSCFRDSYRLGV
ncbi:uncharacterized protein LOC124150701 [Haliotis rufescens]|uniref:uncharacterized protein LOC124150701 n=1 Tax=Haliotis rufescens TaxID=6454 RepID=UPI00201F1523|nr:uncharacterized protein LOC124150701 [Haliotis rufescens]